MKNLKKKIDKLLDQGDLDATEEAKKVLLDRHSCAPPVDAFGTTETCLGANILCTDIRLLRLWFE
jgi:hypothetical protein